MLGNAGLACFLVRVFWLKDGAAGGWGPPGCFQSGCVDIKESLKNAPRKEVCLAR